MAITKTITTATSIFWNIQDTDNTLSSNYFKDYGSFQYAKNYTDSTSGNSAADVAWHDRLSISGTKTILDLQSLTTTAFGLSTTESFSGIRDIYIENITTGVGRTLGVHSTGSLAWTAPWNGGSGNLIIQPGSVFHFNQYLNKWAVTTGSKEITFEDLTGSGITAHIAFMGTSGNS